MPGGVASQQRAPATGPPTGLTAGGDESVSLSYATNPGSRSVSSTSFHASTWDPLPSSSKLFWPFLSFSPSCCTHVVICRRKGRPSHLPIPLYPRPASVPALGLWLPVLTSAAFSSPFLPISAVAVFLPQKLQLLRQEPGRKSGLTTCWWTDEALGLAGIPKTWRAKGGEKDFCPPGVQLPSHLQLATPALLERPSSESRAFLACKGSRSPCHPARNLHLEP